MHSVGSNVYLDVPNTALDLITEMQNKNRIFVSTCFIFAWNYFHNHNGPPVVMIVDKSPKELLNSCWLSQKPSPLYLLYHFLLMFLYKGTIQIEIRLNKFKCF